MQTIEEHKCSVNAVEFSPDGTKLVSGGGDRRVLMYESKMWGQRKTNLRKV
jgi:WD40 repeat protein